MPVRKYKIIAENRVNLRFIGIFVLGNKVLADAGSAEARYRDKGIEYCNNVMNIERTPQGLTLLDVKVDIL